MQSLSDVLTHPLCVPLHHKSVVMLEDLISPARQFPASRSLRHGNVIGRVIGNVLLVVVLIELSSHNSEPLTLLLLTDWAGRHPEESPESYQWPGQDIPTPTLNIHHHNFQCQLSSNGAVDPSLIKALSLSGMFTVEVGPSWTYSPEYHLISECGQIGSSSYSSNSQVISYPLSIKLEKQNSSL